MGQLSFSSSNDHVADSNEHLSTRCTLHSAGHGIAPTVGLNASNMAWDKATMTEVRGTRVRLQTPAGSAYFWNHDPQRLEFLGDPKASQVGAAAPELLWNANQKLLGLRDGQHFYLAHLSDQPLDGCEPASSIS